MDLAKKCAMVTVDCCGCSAGRKQTSNVVNTYDVTARIVSGAGGMVINCNSTT